jgi:hypothetical protein
MPCSFRPSLEIAGGNLVFDTLKQLFIEIHRPSPDERSQRDVDQRR